MNSVPYVLRHDFDLNCNLDGKFEQFCIYIYYEPVQNEYAEIVLLQYQSKDGPHGTVQCVKARAAQTC